MSSQQRLSVRAVIHLLQRADRFNRLAKGCPREHRRSFYRLKDQALARALAGGDEQFEVDSIHARVPLTLGLTHLASGRRVHVRPYRLGGEIQMLLHAMAQSAGVVYSGLRLAKEGDSEQPSPSTPPRILKETVA